MNTLNVAVLGPADQVAPQVPQALEVIRAAIATGNVEMYRDAVSLMKEMDAFASRKAFNNALADASAELPIIKKNRHVSYGEGKGATSYDHEDLAEVVNTVTPILAKHGLKHRWRLQGKPGEPVTVTCILSHRDGYVEENSLSAGADTSGGKNAIQGVKSAVSYLERITLMASLGLASRKDDDDGRGTSVAPVTDEQLTSLIALADEVGADKEKFCAVMKVPSFADIPAKDFRRATDLLNTKRKAAK